MSNAAPPSCPRCGSAATVEGPRAGPHHARLGCGNCGRFIRWLPKPRAADPAPPQRRAVDLAAWDPFAKLNRKYGADYFTMDPNNLPPSLRRQYEARAVEREDREGEHAE
jgi:hypothetical protein